MVEPRVSSSFALFYDSPVLTRDVPSGSLCLWTSFVVTVSAVCELLRSCPKSLCWLV